jgi:hypothetical protein
MPESARDGSLSRRYDAAQPPRLGTRFRLNRSATSRRRFRLAAKKRPNRRLWFSFVAVLARSRPLCPAARGSRPLHARSLPCSNRQETAIVVPATLLLSLFHVIQFKIENESEPAMGLLLRSSVRPRNPASRPLTPAMKSSTAVSSPRGFFPQGRRALIEQDEAEDQSRPRASALLSRAMTETTWQRFRNNTGDVSPTWLQCEWQETGDVTACRASNSTVNPTCFQRHADGRRVGLKIRWGNTRVGSSATIQARCQRFIFITIVEH